MFTVKGLRQIQVSDPENSFFLNVFNSKFFSEYKHIFAASAFLSLTENGFQKDALKSFPHWLRSLTNQFFFSNSIAPKDKSAAL